MMSAPNTPDDGPFPILSIPKAPTAGGIGHSKITEALSCVYSSFDYGQNIELDVESLVSTFARSTPQTVVSPTQTNESKEVHDTLHHLFILYTWMRLEKISEEEILERFSEASTDGNNTKYISGSLLTGIARYIQALKSHPDQWNKLMNQEVKRDLRHLVEFLKKLNEIPNLSDRILLMQIVKETQTITDSILSRFSSLLDALTQSEHFPKFLGMAASITQAVGGSPNISLPNLYDTFSRYRGTKKASPWVMLIEHTGPAANEQNWSDDLWMFDSRLLHFKSEDVLQLINSFTKLKAALSSLYLSGFERKIAELKMIIETSLQKAHELNARIAEVVDDVMLYTDPEQKNFNCMVSSICQLREQYLKTKEELLRDTDKNALESFLARQAQIAERLKAEKISELSNLSISSKKARESFEFQEQLEKLTHSVPVHKSYGTSDSAWGAAPLTHSGRSIQYRSQSGLGSLIYYPVSDPIPDGSHLRNYYSLDYLTHPLPNLLKEIEQLKEDYGYYNQNEWEMKRGEYRERLMELLDKTYQSLNHEVELFISSVSHEDGYF